MLCDAGPLVALIDHSDKNHARCIEVISSQRTSLLTTWPCFTEAMYLLGRYGGQPAQDEIWSCLEDRVISIHTPSDLEQRRMRVLMRKYRDTPMDLADASLVAAAEVLKQRRIFTTDSDFLIYMIDDKTPFDVVP